MNLCVAGGVGPKCRTQEFGLKLNNSFNAEGFHKHNNGSAGTRNANTGNQVQTTNYTKHRVEEHRAQKHTMKLGEYETPGNTVRLTGETR